MGPDLSADYRVVDHPEPVTYYAKTGEGAYAAARAVGYAQAAAATAEDVRTTPGLLEGDSCVFTLWRGPLGDLRPRLGDRIVDARGGAWTVRRVQPCDRDAGGYQRYRLTTTAEF